MLSHIPPDEIPHAKVGERVIPTFADQQIVDLLDHVDPSRHPTPVRHFRAIGNLAMLLLLTDTRGRKAELTRLTFSFHRLSKRKWRNEHGRDRTEETDRDWLRFLHRSPRWCRDRYSSAQC